MKVSNFTIIIQAYVACRRGRWPRSKAAGRRFYVRRCNPDYCGKVCIVLLLAVVAVGFAAAAEVSPPPPPAATDLRTTTSSGAEPASPAQLQRSGVTVPGAPGTFTRSAPGTNPSDSSAASMTASDPTNAAVAAALRDPFWPLGYTPGPTNAVAPPPGPEAQDPARSNAVAAVDAQAQARSLIRVQGFVRRGTQSYVMINGRMTGVGDIINIQTQGVTWRFVLRRIDGRQVTIEPLP